MHLKKKNKVVKELPDDLMIEIAQRLPAKSVGRFRCVSKQWNIFLSSPEFVKSHLRGASEGMILIDYNSHYPTYTVTQLASNGSSRAVKSKRLKGSTAPKLLGSCNGFVLLEVVKPKFKSRALILFNPVTFRAVQLPHSLTDRNSSRVDLGYCSVDDDYKIVAMTRGDKKVKVFSLRNRSFRKSTSSPFPLLSYDRRPGVCTGGRLHWLAEKRRIIAFDLSTRKFEEVPPPIGFDDRCCKLVMMGGCLALTEDSDHMISTTIDVWIMEKPEYWRRFTIANFSHSSYYVVSRLGELEFVLAEGYTKMVAYNCETRAWRDVDVDGLINFYYAGDGTRVLPFTETLVCPNHMFKRQHA